MKRNIVSFSGGKDSTAMLLMLLERGEHVEEILYFDTGWDFPEMDAHIKEVEELTGMKVTRLKPKQSFEYLMFEHPVVSSKTGELSCVGYGWPSAMRRWCTREKSRALRTYLRGLEFKDIPGDIVVHIGFASDEAHRVDKQRKDIDRYELRFPLIEWGVDEKAALEYCKDKGLSWGGLYNHFKRVSCYCCPLQSMATAQILKNNYPDLWNKMLQMESRITHEPGKRFLHEYKVSDL